VRKNICELKPKHAVELSKEFLKQQLYKKLVNGQKIVLFSGSKKFLTEEVEPLVESTKKKCLFYTADSDDQKKNDVKSIREKWSEVSLVAYTPCITVGVNYDVPDNFDCVFCYGLPSCGVRDYFQALYRVRQTKASKLYYTIQHFPMDRKEISKKAIAETFERNAKNKKQQHKNLIKQLGINEDFDSPPSWLNDIHICNLSEKNLSDCHFRTMFKYYLKINNYLTKREDITDTKEDFKKKANCLEWDDLPNISDENKDEIEKKVKHCEATMIEKLTLRKFYLNKVLPSTGEESKKKIWTTIQQTEKMNKFYRFLYEANNKTEDMIRNEFQQKTYGAFVDDLKTSFPLVKELMKTVGLNHSCDTKEIDQNTLTDNADKIRDLSKKLSDRLGIIDRKKTVDTKNKNQSLQAELKSSINGILQAWSGSTLKSKSSRKRVNGERQYVYSYFIQPMDGLEDIKKVQPLGNFFKKK
jgi:hypothetical protein